MDADPVARAALFPMGDVPPPPGGHPDRLIDVAGVRVLLGWGLPHGVVFPEQVPAGELRPVLRHVRERLREEGRTKGVWLVPEAADPAGLAKRLQELGLTPIVEPPFEPRSATMAAFEPPPRGPSDVEAHRVRTFEEFREAFRVGGSAFALDPELAAAYVARAELLWPFQARDGGRATFVATIAGEVVGFAEASFGRTAVLLGGSGTHPDYRGRGVYRAMVRARWDAAVQRRTPALTIAAGEMSRPILERLGFSIVGWNDCLRDDLTA